MATGDIGLGDYGGPVDLNNLIESPIDTSLLPLLPDPGAGPISNNPGSTLLSASAPSSANPGDSIGGILNGIAGIVSAGSKIATALNSPGTVQRPLYRPLSATALGSTVGSSAGLLLLAGIAALGFIVFAKKKKA